MMLIPDVGATLYNAVLRTGVQNRHVRYALSAGTYYVDYFNAKVKVAIFQQREDWEVLQIKDLSYSYHKITCL